MGSTWNITEEGIKFTTSVMSSLKRIAKALERIADPQDLESRKTEIALEILNEADRRGITYVPHLIQDLERTQNEEAARSNLSSD